ncbi:MAG: NAD-dependent epimerase/dehydratase family protein [Synergistetes bacterium]|nr:NAD-dependent epimerase/dehydratase family protein [Synergistota bacterium]
MRVLVTGGGGYIGSVLVRLLLDEGHNVRVVDRFFFGEESLKSVADRVEILKADIRDIDESVFGGVDVVMDLAALSNDPSGELEPQKTIDINYLGRLRVAHLSKKVGVKRYILASSCSIYGAQDGMVNEESDVNPLTTYASANYLAEQGTLVLGDDNFVVTALRQATVFGYSYRMRFDLAINGMVGAYHTYGELKVLRDGTQWRPFVYVRDTSNAFIQVMKAPSEKVNKQVFNVGGNEFNIQILELAKLVTSSLNKPFEFSWYGDPDKRSYRVDFSKIKETLGYKPTVSFEDGIKELWQKLEEGSIRWDDPTTRTVNWYKTLIEWNNRLKAISRCGQIL